jgi:prepilin-type N-terminal cleavage/methylation domain-containing protein
MRSTASDTSGFSLIELLVAMAGFLIVFSTVSSGLMQVNHAQHTIWNRTEMHSGLRSATELLQQEVGQAGKIAIPGTATLAAAVYGTGSKTVGLLINGTASVSGVYTGEFLTVDAGDGQETVQVTGVSTTNNTITAFFGYPAGHLAGVPVQALGGFAQGVIPTNMTNGSTGYKLKLLGDINDDGNVKYVEYFCDPTTTNALYRNAMAWDTTAASKPAAGPSQILLTDVQPNPDASPCFSYQQVTVGTNTFVTALAVTLTVRTLQKDSLTRQYDSMTKALLNVAPRNVFSVWQMSTLNGTNRIQPLPTATIALLP